MDPVEEESKLFVDKYYSFLLHHLPQRLYRFYERESLTGRPKEDGTTNMWSFKEQSKEPNLNILTLGFESAEVTRFESRESHGGGISIVVDGYLNKSETLGKNFTQKFFLSPRENGSRVVISDILELKDDIQLPLIQPGLEAKEMPQITEFLVKAQSADATVRKDAEDNLLQLEVQNLPQFLQLLSSELAKNDKPPESRQLAGILLNNFLDAKDYAKKDHLVQQRLGLDPDLKSLIKLMLVSTLGSSALEARHTSAQVIAKVASIEIPQAQWPELVQLLLQNMTKEGSPAHLKQSTLETLGYVCEEMSHRDLVQDDVNSVLNEILKAMNQSETAGVRLAATKALLNVLNFYQNEAERTKIINMVYETARSEEAGIRRAAFECLVSIASTYYQVLEAHMETLSQLTYEVMETHMETLLQYQVQEIHMETLSQLDKEESVALQAIEFWSSICDEEIGRNENHSPDTGDPPPPFYSFMEKALPNLVPMILKTLDKQKDDVWNISMAGGTCLGLVARTVGDGIVPLVMPFVEINIRKLEWQSREAAAYAFGSILEGPTIDKLAPMVAAVLEFLLTAINDNNKHVRDTAAWTLSRILKFLHPDNGFSVITPINLPGIVNAILQSIRYMPNVPENVQQNEQNVPENVCRALSPFLTGIVTHMLTESQTGTLYQPPPPRFKEDLSGSERKSLQALKRLVQEHLDSNPGLERTIWGIVLLEEEGSEIVLLKFLRARNFKVQKSLNMLKDTMEWRKTADIDTEVHFWVDERNSIFMCGHDLSGHPVCYDKVYSDFNLELLHFDRHSKLWTNFTQLVEAANTYVKSRVVFFERSLREDLSSGGRSIFLYVFDMDNYLGLNKKQLNLVSKLTKEGLELAQNTYPDFAFKQLFINCSKWNYLHYKMLSLYKSPGSMAREVVVATRSKSFDTLLKYIEPNQIPTRYGGLCVNPEDFSSDDTSSTILVDPLGSKTLEIECPTTCEILLTFKSTGNHLTYESAFIPGSFTTTGGQTTFTRRIADTQFAPIAVANEVGVSSHSFTVTESGKCVLVGNNPTNNKTKLVFSYNVKY